MNTPHLAPPAQAVLCPTPLRPSAPAILPHCAARWLATALGISALLMPLSGCRDEAAADVDDASAATPATGADAAAADGSAGAGAGVGANAGQGTSAVDAASAPNSLQAELDARAQASAALVPADVRDDMDQALRDLEASGLAARAITTGDTAPAFELPDATGASIRLGDLLADGPVVLTWYRGGWCPYCNLQLRAYQEILPQVRERGGRLVAITPETPDQSLSTTEKNNLEFTVLSDAGNQVAASYGLVFTLPDNLVERYRGFGIDLEQSNGDDSWTLPLAATYVIDSEGTVVWAFVEADYRKRAEPGAILAALDALPAAPATASSPAAPPSGQ